MRSSSSRTSSFLKLSQYKSLISWGESLVSWDAIRISWEGGNLLLSGTVVTKQQAKA